MARSNSPVSSFGPELMSVLRKGADEKTEYLFDTPQTAFRFMSRVNALRAAMRRENHKDSDRVYRAGLTIAKDNKCKVIVQPRDSEFGDILSNAGTAVRQTPPTNQDGSAAESAIDPPGIAPDSADAFLSSLTSKKGLDGQD